VKRWYYLAPLVALGVAVVVLAIADTGGERADERPRGRSVAAGVADEEAPSHVRWLAFGGGVEPGSNQVSIEQDLAAVGKLLGKGGITLFAGGAGRSPVQVLNVGDGYARKGGLHRRLGDLFWPQDGRSASYRPTMLSPQSDARAETVMGALVDALEEDGDEPLYVFVSAHGEPGRRRSENLVRLWGGTPISALDLTELLDSLRATRPLRLVMATCFSGGFAEMTWRQARPENGATRADRCGLFATTWDSEAAGCDPNPNRRAQESYFLHLLNALQGQDRQGTTITLDLDGDNAVSLLEAHTRVRIASYSISVPTSTSERFLRQAAAQLRERRGKNDDELSPPDELVEEHAVVLALGARLELENLDEAIDKLESLRAEVQRREKELEPLRLALEVTSADLRIALLERWPVLDDAYHPAYASTLSQNEAAIRQLLDASPLSKAHGHARAALRKAEKELDLLDVSIAMVRRLVRAHENLAAAALLREYDEKAYARFMRFVHCERSIPPVPLSRRAQED
jgi:hypothetical protein